MTRQLTTNTSVQYEPYDTRKEPADRRNACVFNSSAVHRGNKLQLMNYNNILIQLNSAPSLRISHNTELVPYIAYLLNTLIQEGNIFYATDCYSTDRKFMGKMYNSQFIEAEFSNWHTILFLEIIQGRKKLKIKLNSHFPPLFI